MIKKSKGTILIYQAENLAQQSDIDHFFTTRTGGVSVEVFHSLNFGTQHGEAENMTTNLQILSASFQFDQSRIVLPKQTHSDRIAVITNNYSEQILDETDALITNQSSVCLAVKTADCVPILLFDPVKKVVAAIHAGWKGTISKIAGNTIQQMTEKFGCNPADIVAGIGPSIHIHAYEVGPEVVSAVMASFGNHIALLKPSMNEGRAYFDLWEANQTVLMESGIQEEHIELMGLCSFEQADLFYSARRDGTDTGRMVSGIRLI